MAEDAHANTSLHGQRPINSKPTIESFTAQPEAPAQGKAGASGWAVNESREAPRDTPAKLNRQSLFFAESKLFDRASRPVSAAECFKAFDFVLRQNRVNTFLDVCQFAALLQSDKRNRASVFC